jgi:hypothetical protein
LKAILLSRFFHWHRSRKAKEMLERVDQDHIFDEQDGIKHLSNAIERKKPFDA